MAAAIPDTDDFPESRRFGCVRNGSFSEVTLRNREVRLTSMNGHGQSDRQNRPYTAACRPGRVPQRRFVTAHTTDIGTCGRSDSHRYRIQSPRTLSGDADNFPGQQS
jgi:hypothetical protein